MPAFAIPYAHQHNTSKPPLLPLLAPPVDTHHPVLGREHLLKVVELEPHLADHSLTHPVIPSLTGRHLGHLVPTAGRISRPYTLVMLTDHSLLGIKNYLLFLSDKRAMHSEIILSRAKQPCRGYNPVQLPC
jgi:hypothetical protein